MPRLESTTPPLDPVSIVDVLENALGELSAFRVARLTPPELEELAGLVNAFYDAWTVPPVPTDDLRLYSGGWVAGNTVNEDARQHLYTSLLYAPSVVIHDPVAEWFDPNRDSLTSPPPLRGARGGLQIQGAEPQLRRGDGYFAFRNEPDRSRAWLSTAVPMLAELAPLIRRGTVVPIPQWRVVRPLQQAILTAVRHDSINLELAKLIEDAAESPPRADHIRGMDVSPDGGVVPADRIRAIVQNPAYFLNKTMIIAEATGGRYIPPATTDVILRDYRIGKLQGELKRKDINLQVVSGLAAAELPFLGSLDPKTIVKVHRDEQAFADWRAELRTIARAIESTPSQGGVFEAEAREVIADALLPRARALQQAVSRSNVMKAAASDQAVTFGIGAASVTGAAVIAGSPVGLAAMAGLGISAIGRAVYASTFGAAKRSHGVLGTLVKKR